MLEMTTKMILEMLLHRNEIQKRIFQTQSDCATFEMKTDPTEPFSSLPPQFIFNKFCSLGVSWEVAVWRRNDKLIMNSISPHITRVTIMQILTRSGLYLIFANEIPSRLPQHPTAN